MRSVRLPTAVLAIALAGSVAPAAHEGASGDGRTALREEFLSWRFGMFLHFNMATYIDHEWANGYEDPALFKPDRLDCGQWLDLARAAGMRYAVLTVKHTGGWCLWDSEETTHDVAGFVNYKEGKGDIVREFVDACRERGLKVGFYYCFPGDFSRPGIGNPVPEGKPDLHGLPPEAAGDYVGFIKRQLRELLTGYGPVDLVWIDQYRNRYTYARWQEIRDHIRALQPKCIVIGNNAHDLAESDVHSCELPWDPNGMLPEGNTVPAEVSDKMSGNWFWNTRDTPEHVKSVEKLTKTRSLCNERRANYLLNVPPDRSGRISGEHRKRLRELAAARVDGQSSPPTRKVPNRPPQKSRHSRPAPIPFQDRVGHSQLARGTWWRCRRCPSLRGARQRNRSRTGRRPFPAQLAGFQATGHGRRSGQGVDSQIGLLARQEAQQKHADP